MGLDMYLTKKTYIGAEYNHRNIKGVISLTGGKESTPIPIKVERVSEISERIGYWRKANAIHQWFVMNCQDGTDNCREAYVGEEKLNELLDICKKIRADNSHAAELLPCQSGFFFGPTEYNEWYFANIDQTIKILEGALTETGGDIYYQSSW